MEQDWAGLGQRLRARRLERGLSQEAVGAFVGVDKSMVSRWEAGEKISEPAQVFALEQLLELGPGDLSRLAGYLPLAAVPVVTVEDAIIQDQQLRPRERQLVLIYRQGLIDAHETGRRGSDVARQMGPDGDKHLP